MEPIVSTRPAPTPSGPLVLEASLIVASRNRPQLLADTVASILCGDVLPSELLIVDQSREPNPSLASLSHPGCQVRYLRTDSVGLSRANNTGVAAAHHDVLVFTHDDVIATPAWMRSIVAAQHEAGPRGVVTGRVLPGEPEVRGGIVPTRIEDEQPVVYEGRIGRDVLFPLNMAMHRAVLADVGGFDPRLGPGTPYPAGEDNDLGFRLLEAGYRIFYRPDVVLYHRAWRNERSALRWAYGRGQGGFYAKYLTLSDRYMLGRFWRDVSTHVLRVPSRIRWRDRRGLWGDVVYTTAVLNGIVQWLLMERRRAR